MRVGDKLEWLEKMASEGHFIPDLENRPELLDIASPYWAAFLALRPSRNSQNRIPFSEIKSYCEFYGIREHEDKEDFVKFISDLDEHEKKKGAG